MATGYNNKITSLVQLFDRLPESERIIVDVLRQIIREHLPNYCKEKLAFNVPYFYGHRGICIIWPIRRDMDFSRMKTFFGAGNDRKGRAPAGWLFTRIRQGSHA
jgi:hypothetical protein